MSNVNWMGFIALGLGLVAFQVTHQRLGRKPWKMRLWVASGFGVLAIPSILTALYYLHVLPERAWFYEMRSLRGSEFLFIMLGVSAGALASALPRVILPALLLIVTGVGVLPYLKPMFRPLDEKELRSEWSKGGCLQSTASTCGPASIVTILHSLGINVTEKEIAHASHTYGGGTEAWYLARYVRSKGCKAHFHFARNFQQLPALVGVRVSGYGHFIAVLSVTETECVISDPLHGLERLGLRDFQQRYEFTGFQMSVNR